MCLVMISILSFIFVSIYAGFAVSLLTLLQPDHHRHRLGNLIIQFFQKQLIFGKYEKIDFSFFQILILQGDKELILEKYSTKQWNYFQKQNKKNDSPTKNQLLSHLPCRAASLPSPHMDAAPPANFHLISMLRRQCTLASH